MKRLIIISILVVSLAISLAIAEGFLFDFYQQTVADQWANIALVPLLIISLIILIRDRWIWSLNEGNGRVIDTIKYAGGGILGLGLFCYFLITPVISGILILVNAYIGEQQPTEISGTVVKKTEISMQRASKHELVILTKTGMLKLETNGVTIKKYDVGGTYEATMKKGSLGLLTKRKSNQ